MTVQDLQDAVKSVSLVGLPLKKTKQLRIWKLGNLENKILPSTESFNRLNKIIDTFNNNDKPIDIVWGPDIELEVFNIEYSDDSVDIIHVAKNPNTQGEK